MAHVAGLRAAQTELAAFASGFVNWIALRANLDAGNLQTRTAPCNDPPQRLQWR